MMTPRGRGTLPVAVLAGLLALGAVLPTAPVLSQRSAPVVVRPAAVDATVAPYVGTQIPGLSVAVGYRGRVIFAKAYGKADLESGAPMTPQHRLCVGSLTKQMTSGALLTLQRDGLLSVTDRVNVLLPQYQYGDRMTLRQLSTMSSGLQGAEEDGDALFGIVGADTHSSVPQVFAKLNAIPPIRPPNTKWDYANIGYWLLGRALEAATHRPYASVMQARVFSPLGMRTAYIRGTRPDVNLATGYTRFGDGTFHRCPELDLASSDAAGMAAMTASDVVVWNEAVRAGRLVKGRLLQAMFTPTGLPLPTNAGLPGDSYAMGWNTRNDPTFGRGVFDHDGNTILYASTNVLFPDGSCVVLLANANYSQFSTDRIPVAYKVRNAIAGLPPVKEFTITAPPYNLLTCPNE